MPRCKSQMISKNTNEDFKRQTYKHCKTTDKLPERKVSQFHESSLKFTQFTVIECRKLRVQNWPGTDFENQTQSKYFKNELQTSHVKSRSADETHGWLVSRLDRWLGNRCWTGVAVGVRVDLGLEHGLLLLNLLSHQPNAENVGRNFAKTDAHLYVSQQAPYQDSKHWRKLQAARENQPIISSFFDLPAYVGSLMPEFTAINSILRVIWNQRIFVHWFQIRSFSSGTGSPG